jgi:ribosomal protein L20A (L18A)
MKKYKFKFTGVKNGSIGKRLNFTKVIESENFEDAKLKLYDTHEHIRILSVNGIKPNKDYNFNIK